MNWHQFRRRPGAGCELLEVVRDDRLLAFEAVVSDPLAEPALRTGTSVDPDQ
jgi:hypothetical protein